MRLKAKWHCKGTGPAKPAWYRSFFGHAHGRKTPFGDLQALPSNAKPISRWSDRDEACLDAARGVMKVVDSLNVKPISEPTNAIGHAKSAEGVRTPAQPADSKVIYCGKCGVYPGSQTICTGTRTHHEFAPGSVRDYCSRCGLHPGAKTVCTGTQTHHTFVSAISASVMCSRCGVSVGNQTICTGVHTAHAFKEF